MLVILPLLCVCLLVLSLWKTCCFQSHRGWQRYAYVLSGRTFQLLKSVDNFLDRLLQLECTPEVCRILQVFSSTFQRPNLTLAEMQVQPTTGCVAYLIIVVHSWFLIGTQSPDS